MIFDGIWAKIMSKIWTYFAGYEIMLINAFLNISQETQKCYNSIVNALFLHCRFLLEDTQLDQTFQLKQMEVHFQYYNEPL